MALKPPQKTKTHHETDLQALSDISMIDIIISKLEMLSVSRCWEHRLGKSVALRCI